MVRIVLCAALSTALAAHARAADGPAPPQLRSGALPRLPGSRVGAGEVLLEATIDVEGRVSETRALRVTPPYADRLHQAVQAWRFAPALDAAGDPTTARILIAGVFAPTALAGPAPGQLPEDVGEPSADLPYPTTTVPAAYPVTGRGDGSVLVEIQVGADGRARSTKVLESAGPAFDVASLQMLAGWRFRSGAAGNAYVVVGYREPSVGQPASPRPR